MTRSKITAIALLSSLLSTHLWADEEIMMDFDFSSSDVTQGFGKWLYSDKGTNPCDVYGGENQSKLCSTDNYRFYQYYNWNNSDHLGWMRYGYLDASDTFSVSGSSLEVAITGGQYEDANGVIQDSGAFIKSKGDFENSPKENVYADRILKGDLSLYYKTSSTTTKIPELAGKNRFSLWILMPKDIINIDDYNYTKESRPDQNIAWYPFIDTSKAGHYYHHASNIPMGGWTKVQFDAHPTHHNAGINNAVNGLSEGGTSYPGDGASYMTNVAAFSIRAGFSANTPSPISYYIDDMSTDFVMYENEETISNVGVGYNPDNHLFDISFEDKYRCTDCSAEYEVRYSFSPINNENFDSAHIPSLTTNFKRSSSNDSGMIYKPNPGYNILWAALDLQPEHRSALTENMDIYFAIKDKSIRNFDQQAIDFELVNVPNVGQVRKMDLIKTIKYKTIPVSYPIEITTDNIDTMIIGHNFSQKLDATGQSAPYEFEAISLPVGLSISPNGTISGVPQKEGPFELIVKVNSSNGKNSTRTFSIYVKTEADFDTLQCSEIVDFKSDQSFLSSSFFDTIIHDNYTGFDDIGSSIFVGNNKDYNYQGVTGSGLPLAVGDKIRVTYFNNGEQPLTFTPKLSLNDPDRRGSGITGDWYDMDEITVPGKAYSHLDFVIAEGMTLLADVININTYHASNKILIVDKIEFIDSDGNPDDVCYFPFEDSTKQVYVAVDFNSSNENSITEIPGWDTIVIDQYSGYFDTGTSILLGDNPSYNYQGVTGVTRNLQKGTQVIAYWKNISNNSLIVSPNVSFDDSNRISSEPNGTWYSMESITIEGESEGVSKFVIDEYSAGLATGININSNTRNNKALVLDRIEVVSLLPIYEITTRNLEEQVVGHYNEQRIEVLGGESPYSFSTIDELPNGMSLSDDGVLSGSPLEAFNGEINISATDNQGVLSTQTLNLVIKNEQDFNVEYCELIVDFNYSKSSSIISSSLFSSIIKDTYTDYTSYGLSIVFGNNEYYDYQGVSGDGFNISTGEKIRVIWFNNSDEHINFAPYISFNDPDRKDFGVNGTWSYIGEVNIPPYSYKDAEFSVTPDLQGEVSLINISNAYRNNQILSVDKIEFISDKLSKSDICKMPFRIN